MESITLDKGRARASQDTHLLAAPGAFSQLYQRTHLVVYRYVYGLHGGPQEDVEDLTAETYERAWKARQRFRGDEDAALGWLLLIARRLVIDRHRRRQVRGLQEDLSGVVLTSPDGNPEEDALAAERMQVLVTLLQALPRPEREMLVLRYVLGWRVKRIAAHLSLAENTVSVKIRRALEKLRDRWPDDPSLADAERRLKKDVDT